MYHRDHAKRRCGHNQHCHIGRKAKFDRRKEENIGILHCFSQMEMVIVILPP